MFLMVPSLRLCRRSLTFGWRSKFQRSVLDSNTGCVMAGLDFLKFRFRLTALLPGVFAARSERATGNRLRQIRRQSGNRVKLRAFVLQRRTRPLQRFVVGMERAVKKFGGGGRLHNL